MAGLLLILSPFGAYAQVPDQSQQQQQQLPPDDDVLLPPEPPADDDDDRDSGSEVRSRVPTVRSSSVCLEYNEDSHGIEIACDADISEVYFGLRDDLVLENIGSGQFLLKTNLTVLEDATFTINSDSGIKYLKIADNNGITVYGNIQIDGVKITSWDTRNDKVIEIDADSYGLTPRAYLLLDGTDGGYIIDSELGYMGYNDTGYRGVDLLHNVRNFEIKNSTFHHMWYAFYSNGASNITISSSEYHDNLKYAIDPHTGTYNMRIVGNKLHHNPIAAVCSLDCSDIVFENNTIYENERTGIFFSRNTQNSVARYNNIYNQSVGIAFSESPNNKAYGNTITSVGRAFLISNPENADDGFSTGNYIYNNTVRDSSVGVSALRSSQNILANNNFYNITMAHYRLNEGATVIIDNQTLHNATIRAYAGDNIIRIMNSGMIQMNGSSTHNTVIQPYAVTLSNQTMTISSVPRSLLSPS